MRTNVSEIFPRLSPFMEGWKIKDVQIEWGVQPGEVCSPGQKNIFIQTIIFGGMPPICSIESG